MRCGRRSAGLRLYYDAAGRESRFDATITPGPSEDLYLRSNGTACGGRQSTGVTAPILDGDAPAATSAKCRDSAGLSFSGGNPFEEIGTWLPELSL